MKYWVMLDTEYNVTHIDEIDETLKDGETKDKDDGLFKWSITEPARSFLKGGVLRVTCSGALSIEVEAESEEEARRIAPMAYLKKRIADLEDSLRRSGQSEREARELQKKWSEEQRATEKAFMSMIRAGELSIVNTGRRITGSWFDLNGERAFEVEPTVGFARLINEIQNSTIKYDDCY